MGSKPISSVLLVLLSVLAFQHVTATGKPCSDIVTVRDSKIDTVMPRILYFEGAGLQLAQISCEGEASGIVELITENDSLGIIEKGSHKAICRLGRWYSLNKYGGITVVKDVACLVHLPEPLSLI